MVGGGHAEMTHLLALVVLASLGGVAIHCDGPWDDCAGPSVRVRPCRANMPTMPPESLASHACGAAFESADEVVASLMVRAEGNG